MDPMGRGAFRRELPWKTHIGTQPPIRDVEFFRYLPVLEKLQDFGTPRVVRSGCWPSSLNNACGGPV